MGKRKVDLSATYQGIAATSRITGMASSAIRAGCRNGIIPHVMCGKEYRINVPLFQHLLEKQSISNMKG